MKKRSIKIQKIKQLRFSKAKVASLNNMFGGRRVDEGGGAKTTEFPECQATDVTCHWTETTCDYKCGG